MHFAFYALYVILFQCNYINIESVLYLDGFETHKPPVWVVYNNNKTVYNYPAVHFGSARVLSAVNRHQSRDY